MMRPLLVVLASLSIAGCGWLKDSPRDAVLADLEYQPVTIEKRATQAAPKEEIIENYRELLSLTPDQRLSSEATRRLADLELDLNEEKLLDQPAYAASPKPIELSSIALYESLLQTDPNYPNRDLVLYQLARAYEVAGAYDRMMATLDRLIVQHPESAYWGEAQFRRGERLFVLQQHAAAEAAYQAILDKRQGSAFYDRALFKHGWSRFKQRRTEAGLDSFTLLLDRKLGTQSVVDVERLSPADRELLKETLRVISLIFADLGGTGQIQPYFNRHGHRNYEFMVYSGLGDLYRKQDRIGDAADAYLAFVELNPTHAQAPRLSVQVIDLYAKHGFPLKALESKKAFTQRYGIQGQYWNRLSSDNQQWLSAQLRTYLRELAEYHHALAQQAAKLKGKKARAEEEKQGGEAVVWYQRFLDAFPEDRDAGGMSFLLAELLFDLKRYTEAVPAYENSAYHYPAHDKAAEAGYAALLAYTAEEKRLPEERKVVWRRQGIDSALRFADRFPRDVRHAAVLTQAADQLLGIHELSRASEVALRVTQLEPAPELELRRTAWSVVAHAAFEQQRFSDAEQAYQQTLATLPPKDKARKALEERLAASIYQQATALREQGDHRAAADRFLRVGALVPGASIRETAEYDAAASLITAKDWPATIEVLEGFRLQYPKSQRLPEINTRLAVAYLENKQPLKAAAELRVIAKQGKTPELRREAGWQAAELYAQANQSALAISAYKVLVKDFPEPLEQSLEARQKLVELYDKQNDMAKRDYWLKQIIKTDAKAGKARTDRIRFLAAQASLRLAQPSYESFEAIALKAPLKKNLKRKKQQMQKAIAAYKQAAEYGVAGVTTEATFRIGEIYRHFGQALLDSERPKGLKADELEQYEILLEEQAYPFEDKAIALHEANSKRAADGIYDTWVRKSFDALAKLLPARYAKYEKSEEVVDALN